MSDKRPNLPMAEQIRLLLAQQRPVAHVAAPVPPEDLIDQIKESYAHAKPFVLRKIIVPVTVPVNTRELSSRMAGSSTQVAAAAIRKQQTSYTTPDTKSLLDMIETLQKKVEDLESKTDK